MKKALFLKCILFAMIAGSTVLVGCARQYTVTLQNGSRMQVIGKPKVDKGSYIVKDANGQESRIPITRVKEISPSSMAGSGHDSGFTARPGN